MKERIYTIRINEAFDEKCGCPLCSLYKFLENNEVDIITGAAMMEPDIRIKTNKEGFCKKHYSDMLQSGKNRLPVALILETHLSENILKMLQNPPASQKDFVKKILPQLDEHLVSCYICNRIDYNMNNIFETVIFLFKTEPDFKEKFNNQHFFCINHFASLMSFAAKYLDKKTFKEFSENLYKLEKDFLQKAYDNLQDFTRQFDYRADPAKNDITKNAIEEALKVISP